MKNNANNSSTILPLTQMRNRWVASVRMIMLGLDPVDGRLIGEAEPLFAGGDPMDLNVLTRMTAYMEADHIVTGDEPEMIYVEFAGMGDASEPRAIHVIAKRDGMFFLRRDCTLWLDPQRRSAALMSESAKGGHFVIKDDEVINLPGRPAPSTAAGYTRAAARLRELAANMSQEETRRCFEPPMRRAA